MERDYSRRSVLGLLGSGSVAALAGCTSGSGTTIDISGGVGPRMAVENWADIYESEHDVTFDINGGGTGVGVSEVLEDQVDIAMMGRDPFDEEIDRGLFAVPMLIDTVVGSINEANPIIDEIQERGMTRETLEAIFTREIENWGEVYDDVDVDEEIVVYGRSDTSAAYKQWGDFLGGEDDAHSENELEGLSDGNHDGDSAVQQAIANEENAISLNNINYVYDDSGELEGALRPVPLDQDGTGLSEEEDFYDDREQFLDAVEAGKYPFPPAREMFLAANDQFDDEAYDFVEWVLTEGQEHVRESGYVPLEEDRLEEAQQRLEEAH
ncbi:PstS family phosphate ABC transporter substrate-binding protein [Halopiger goleimassiliensis]|uniref:PstS family phosphate ABC transporter substrate-binding protein n=1 Tax=Halopiger goleimassiliensis TaxID=1293048 RepID=UPI0006776857|nr:substrate-binding domain-containing protein [Halopiger goleimassiliensis]